MSAASACHLFGIRHHGPGGARSLLRALEALQPDCLLVEGPPEGEELLDLLDDAALQPPVALLIYDPDAAQQAVFYPFAEFSPEWNALRFARARGIPARFIDLPVAHKLALARAADEAADDATLAEGNTGDEPATALAADPLDWLGRAAGYGDGEAWWNHLVEERGDCFDLFTAIGEAMSSVRAEVPVRRRPADQRLEALREAHMRKCLRQAEKDGYTCIAVVCGAWHVPALQTLPAAKSDNELLKGLPKVRVSATWVPWSNHHLSFASGYGAGVIAPGWYEHLWRCPPERRAIGWLARAARLLRDEGLDCSSAHLIEGVRLAETLAALRERAQPGLDELDEALRSVVCLGDEAPMQLIRQQLTVGNRLGQTPDSAPAVPLQRDLLQRQKSLRLKADTAQKLLDLDLRQPIDLERSHLLHRLNLLDIDWGRLQRQRRQVKGSFHELWQLQWEPAMTVAVIDASRWGNTVIEAAVAIAVDRAGKSHALPELAALIQQVLLADLPPAIAAVGRALENQAAVVSDVGQLLAAIPPLAHVARYGNVRQTDAGMVEQLLDSLLPRAAIGLPGACSAVDDDAATALREGIGATQQALRLLARPALREQWLMALERLSRLDAAHGLLRGQAARLLFDEQAADSELTGRRMSLALSTANEPAIAAAWLEGFLDRSALILLHDQPLWTMVDQWLTSLSAAHFLRVLPLLRRAFAGFSVPERRQLGERARQPTLALSVAAGPAWQAERAERVLPLLRQFLGLPETARMEEGG